MIDGCSESNATLDPGWAVQVAWTYCHVRLSRAREPMEQHGDEGSYFLSGIVLGKTDDHEQDYALACHPLGALHAIDQA